MKLPALLFSDPHFTSNPRDEYRWGLWKWIREENRDGCFKTLVIAGDLTDAKDYHSSTLVNRLTNEIVQTSALFEELIILRGNHDYLKDGHAFFSFLNLHHKIRFVTQPYETSDAGPPTLFLPHVKNPAQAWAGMDFSHYDYLFLHQTVKGSKASNGQIMDGEELPKLSAMKVYSGDIHVPQIIGPVEYIGSPYPVHYGDKYRPRCIELDRNGKAHDLHYETIARWSITVSSLSMLKRLATEPGDQIKLKIKLAQAEKHEWSKLRREAAEWLKSQGVIVDGIELELERPRRRFSDATEASPASQALRPEDALLRFVQAEELGADAYEVGMEILK